MPTTTLDRLTDQATEAIRRVAQADGTDDYTPAAREAAEVLVDARGLFTAPDGRPDWRGRSWDYRQWVGGLYGPAGVPPAEAQRIQAAIRYHVSNVLRDRLDAEELQEVGLQPESARNRAGAQRAENAAILRAVTGTGLAERDVLLALTAAENLLERLDRDDVEDLPARRRSKAEETLAAILAEANRLTGRRAPRKRVSN